VVLGPEEMEQYAAGRLSESDSDDDQEELNYTTMLVCPFNLLPLCIHGGHRSSEVLENSYFFTIFPGPEECLKTE